MSVHDKVSAMCSLSIREAWSLDFQGHHLKPITVHSTNTDTLDRHRIR